MQEEQLFSKALFALLTIFTYHEVATVTLGLLKEQQLEAVY